MKTTIFVLILAFALFYFLRMIYREKKLSNEAKLFSEETIAIMKMMRENTSLTYYQAKEQYYSFRHSKGEKTICGNSKRRCKNQKEEVSSNTN